jgi:Fe-S-cluster containining protein
MSELPEFNCKQCGNCCLNLYVCEEGSANPEDISRWKQEGRWDILEWVDIYDFYPEDEQYGDIWIDPNTGEDARRCPFLRKIRNQNKYKCLIQDTKPEFCRQYPSNKEQALIDGGKGFGHED